MRQHLSKMKNALCRMTPTLALCFSATLPAFTSAAVVKPPEKKPPPPPLPLIIRYEGKQEERYSNKEEVVIYGVDLLSGKEMKWIVPPADDKAKNYVPKPEVMDIVDQLKAGDYAKVDAKSMYNNNWVNGIDFYKMTPGEELPGNLLFYETYEDKEKDPHVQVVQLRKFGLIVDTILPMKTVNKDSVIDPGMLATVSAMTKGQVVTVEVQNGEPPVLTAIDPYKAPVAAKIGKVVEADVAEGLKGPAITLDEDGTSVTLPIRGEIVGKKWVANPIMLNRLKNTKPGTAVLVSTHDQDGKTFLRDFKLVPKEPAAESGKATTPSKFDK